MIKVEIKPIYPAGSSNAVIEKTIKVIGITIFRKRVTPIDNQGSNAEYVYRC